MFAFLSVVWRGFIYFLSVVLRGFTHFPSVIFVEGFDINVFPSDHICIFIFLFGTSCPSIRIDWTARGDR